MRQAQLTRDAPKSFSPLPDGFLSGLRLSPSAYIS